MQIFTKNLFIHLKSNAYKTGDQNSFCKEIEKNTEYICVLIEIQLKMKFRSEPKNKHQIYN